MAFRVIALLALTIFSTTSTAQAPTEAIKHGGYVVTIDDKNPTAEAVAIKDGKRNPVIKLAAI
jgi:hypothetical protein